MHVDDAVAFLDGWLGGPPSIDVEPTMVTVHCGGQELVYDRRCDPPEVVEPRTGEPVDGPAREAVLAVVGYLDVAARFAARELSIPVDERRSTTFVIECGEHLYGPPTSTAPTAVAVWRAVTRSLPAADVTIRAVEPAPR